MLYLGLGPDEEYDDYPATEPARPRPPAEAEQIVTQPRSVRPVADRTASVSPIPGQPTPAGEPSARFPTHSGPPEQPTVTPVPAERAPGSTGGTSVRTIARPAARPHIVGPRSFTDAQQVADRFKQKQPVIINLQGVDRDLSRRLVDFASGLCYGLGGQMEKVATDVFLLTPTDVEISPEERQRLSDRGLYSS